MIQENELIGRLRELRQVKPRKDWVSLTKSKILGQEAPIFTLFPYFKPAFAGLIAVLVFGGVFGYDLVKNSLPGDLLYSIRKAAHEGQAVFISDTDKPAFQLKLANDRLEDLVKAPVKNLAPTITEFQANIAEAAKNLAKIDATTSDPVAMKKIVEEVKSLKDNKEKAEEVLAIKIEINELDSAVKGLTEREINDLSQRILLPEQEELLNQAKADFEAGNYDEALTKIWNLSQER